MSASIYRELELQRELYQKCQDQYFGIEDSQGEVPQFLAETQPLKETKARKQASIIIKKEFKKTIKHLYEVDKKTERSIQKKDFIGSMFNNILQKQQQQKEEELQRINDLPSDEEEGQVNLKSIHKKVQESLILNSQESKQSPRENNQYIQKYKNDYLHNDYFNKTIDMKPKTVISKKDDRQQMLLSPQAVAGRLIMSKEKNLQSLNRQSFNKDDFKKFYAFDNTTILKTPINRNDLMQNSLPSGYPYFEKKNEKNKIQNIMKQVFKEFNFENNFKKNTTENFQVPQAFLKKPLEQEKYKNFLVKNQGIITGEQALKKVQLDDLRKNNLVSEIIGESGKLIELQMATENLSKISQSYSFDKKTINQNSQKFPKRNLLKKDINMNSKYTSTNKNILLQNENQNEKSSSEQIQSQKQTTQQLEEIKDYKMEQEQMQESMDLRKMKEIPADPIQFIDLNNLNQQSLCTNGSPEVNNSLQSSQFFQFQEKKNAFIKPEFNINQNKRIEQFAQTNYISKMMQTQNKQKFNIVQVNKKNRNEQAVEKDLNLKKKINKVQKSMNIQKKWNMFLPGSIESQKQENTFKEQKRSIEHQQPSYDQKGRKFSNDTAKKIFMIIEKDVQSAGNLRQNQRYENQQYFDEYQDDLNKDIENVKSNLYVKAESINIIKQDQIFSDSRRNSNQFQLKSPKLTIEINNSNKKRAYDQFHLKDRNSLNNINDQIDMNEKIINQIDKSLDADFKLEQQNISHPILDLQFEQLNQASNLMTARQESREKDFINSLPNEKVSINYDTEKKIQYQSLLQGRQKQDVFETDGIINQSILSGKQSQEYNQSLDGVNGFQHQKVSSINDKLKALNSQKDRKLSSSIILANQNSKNNFKNEIQQLKDSKESTLSKMPHTHRKPVVESKLLQKESSVAGFQSIIAKSQISSSQQNQFRTPIKSINDIRAANKLKHERVQANKKQASLSKSSQIEILAAETLSNSQKKVVKSKMQSSKVFLLNDLEKKLKMKDLFKGGLVSMFSGKYVEAQNEKKILEEMFTPRVEIVPENHDWMYTPIYKQYVLKQPEDQSLKETNLMRSAMEIVFEERRKNQKIQQLQKINKVPILQLNSELSLDPQSLLEASLNRLYQNILKEPEITYIINITRKKEKNTSGQDQQLLDKNKLQTYFERAKQTLEFLMTKMALSQTYEKLIVVYQKRSKDNFEDTLIKLLYRCLLGHRSIQKCQKIFKLIPKRELYLNAVLEQNEVVESLKQQRQSSQQFEDFYDLYQSYLEQLESKIAKFCLESSRLHIQISQFLDESNYFKGGKFMFNNIDLLKEIRKDVAYVHNQNQQLLQNNIPQMDKFGRLLFKEKKQLVESARKSADYLVKDENHQQQNSI